MKEEVIQFVWKTGRFNQNSLHTVSGEKLELIERGMLNTGQGPDFQNARIKIDDTLWVGHVEIHVKASEWQQHGHQLDDNYNNVVLHVVLEHDAEVTNKKGDRIPVLTIGNRIPSSIIERYTLLKNNKHPIPCSVQLVELDSTIKMGAMHRALLERFERKVSDIGLMHAQLGQDFAETFFVLLSRYFGSNINALPFQMLAANVGYKCLVKQGADRQLLEAMLFGVAGFLDSPKPDSYYGQLQQEFQHLKNKYSLEAINVPWKLGGNRPHSSPLIKMSQLAHLLTNVSTIYSEITEGSIDTFETLNIEASAYWQTHSHFGKVSKLRSVKAGDIFKQSIIINVLAPFLFFYGKLMDDEAKTEKAFTLLETQKFESNRITRDWNGLNMPTENAADSQALIGLKQNYCDLKKCVLCTIGTHLLK